MERVEHFEVTPAELTKLRLRDGDLLIVEGNGSPSEIGRNALFKDDGQEWIHQNHVIRVRFQKNPMVPKFVSQYLNSDLGKRQMLERAATTSGLYTLSTSKVKSLTVPIPPRDIQMTVSALVESRLCAVQSCEQRLMEELDTIEALPAALLRKAFSGEL